MQDLKIITLDAIICLHCGNPCEHDVDLKYDNINECCEDCVGRVEAIRDENREDKEFYDTFLI